MLVLSAASAEAQLTQVGPCKTGPCAPLTARVRGNSVIPADLFATGRYFGAAEQLPIGTNGSLTVDLGFNVNFGSGLTSTLTVFENGYASLGGGFTVGASGPLPAGNVLAPFSADLSPDPAGGTSGVFLLRGLADPYADGGDFDRADARRAVQVSWYNLRYTDPGCRTAGCTTSPVHAGLLITEQTGTDSNFELLYGPGAEGSEQRGEGSAAGYSVGGQGEVLDPPYGAGDPLFFEFRDGRRVNGAVPEPGSWAQMILGLGVAGALLRRRRRRAPIPAG